MKRTHQAKLDSYFEEGAAAVLNNGITKEQAAESIIKSITCNFIQNW